MIALSLAGMIEILIIYESFSRSLTERAIGLIFAGILVANASNMNQIYYHSYLVYQHDKATADAIMYDIERQGHDYHAKAVVFIGSREMDDIPILKSGSLGGSFFSWDSLYFLNKFPTSTINRLSSKIRAMPFFTWL